MDLTAEAGKRAAEGWQELLVAHLGSAGATLIWTLISMTGVALLLVFARYVGVLGAGDAIEGSLERRAYDNLRASLMEGGSPTRIYGRLLTAFLDWIDRVFVDYDKAPLGVFRHAFRLRRSYPLWTGAAFDRCLSLALIYPIVSIVLIWAISGHAGPAEAAIGLTANAPAWRRSLLVISIGTLVISSPWYKWPYSPRTLLYLPILILPYVILTNIPNGGVVLAITVAFAFVFIVIRTVGFIRNSSGVGPFIGMTVLAAVYFGIIVFAGIDAGMVALIGDVPPGNVVSLAALVGFAAMVFPALAAAYALYYLPDIPAVGQHHVAFVSVFCFTMAAVIICSARWLPSLSTWETSGPVLLFLGLLTTLNAPFNWLSVGLTRALLSRRGVELGGWWPYTLATLDAALALVILVLLAGAMVVGVQTFDLAEFHGGAPPTLPLDPLLDQIATHPGDPVNWWLYALLLCTLMPSLTNLLIGAASLTRGVPGVSALLLRYMPVGHAVPTFDRTWIAAMLTAQWAIGGVLMLVAIAGLTWIVATLVPEMGEWFLDYARWVAAIDLPGHAVALLKALH